MRGKIRHGTGKAKWREKLISQVGESIAETLIALLIASLALVMLAGAMSTAYNIVTESRRKLQLYNDNAERMLSGPGMGSAGTVSIPEDGNLGLLDYEVEYYVNDEFGNIPVVMYEYTP